MDDKSSSGSSGSDKPAKPVVRGKGKGKALNAIAAASGRDPAAIVKSVTEAEAAAKAAAAAEEARKAAEARARAKEKEEATASQIYGSLSAPDQYRFECFRRCGFASEPVGRHVAKALIEEAERRYIGRTGAMVGLGRKWCGGPDDASAAESSSKKSAPARKRKKPSKARRLREESKRRRIAMDQSVPTFLRLRGTENVAGYTGDGGESGQDPIPPLDDLVVPGSASEIVAVVSTLAKCYGQRLVAAARRVADAEEEEGESIGSADAPTAEKPRKPLLPHHFLEAHRHRARAGIDPGFWMAGRIEKGTFGSALGKSSVGATESAALGTSDRDKACHLAALAAQDAYDEDFAEESDQGNDNEMDVESSA